MDNWPLHDKLRKLNRFRELFIKDILFTTNQDTLCTWLNVVNYLHWDLCQIYSNEILFANEDLQLEARIHAKIPGSLVESLLNCRCCWLGKGINRMHRSAIPSEVSPRGEEPSSRCSSGRTNLHIFQKTPLSSSVSSLLSIFPLLLPSSPPSFKYSLASQLF